MGRQVVCAECVKQYLQDAYYIRLGRRQKYCELTLAGWLAFCTLGLEKNVPRIKELNENISKVGPQLRSHSFNFVLLV